MGNSEHPDHLPMVELKGVDLAFGEKSILRDLNFAVQKRERLVVLGQSGSGKSTLLRLITGVLNPNAGSVRFQGKEITKMGRYKLNRIRTRIGMVYQYSALISSLNVRDNLALPLVELTKKSKKEIDRIIDEALEMVDLPDTKKQFPAELSGGMRKRIALARALVMEPELLLFDEPSAGLDPIVSSVIDTLMIDLTERTNATSIIVTHEMDSAFRVATQMAMLYEGRIIEQSTPEEFKASANPIISQFVHGAADDSNLQPKIKQ